MQTAAISYRVADFLKQYPPFQSMEEADLLALAEHGRVKFHEADEYICWQGTPHGPFVYVIQQGTVSLWEAGAGGERLRDIRGAGDLLGIDRFHGSEVCAYSAKTTSDVVVYALRASDFEPLLAKYPQAERYLASHASVSVEYQAPDQRRAAHQVFLYDVVGPRQPPACAAGEAFRDAVRRMSRSGAHALAVVTPDQRLAGVITAAGVLRRIAEGGHDFTAPVESLMDRECCTVAADATVSHCVLAMADAGTEVAAITEDGSAAGRLLDLVTAPDLAAAFADQPV